VAGATENPELHPGDFDTPEQRVGNFNRERPWESCITLCRQWSWKPGDPLKSRGECLRTLALAAGGDGNLLLNVGPMPDGRIEPRQAERLREMGAWLRRHGEAVYDTRGGPYRPGSWGASTCRDQKVYLMIINWPEHGPLPLPSLPARIVESRLADGSPAPVQNREGKVWIEVPEARRDPDVTVVTWTLDRDAFALEPVSAEPPPAADARP